MKVTGIVYHDRKGTEARLLRQLVLLGHHLGSREQCTLVFIFVPSIQSGKPVNGVVPIIFRMDGLKTQRYVHGDSKSSQVDNEN